MIHEFVVSEGRPCLFDGITMNAKIITAALSLILLALTACNTVEGIGRDIESAGEAIQGAGQKGKR